MKNTKKIFGSLAGTLAISLAVVLSLSACSDNGFSEDSVSASDRNGQSEIASGSTTIKAYLPGNDSKSLKKAAFNGSNFTTVATTYTDDTENNEIKVSWHTLNSGVTEKFDVVYLGPVEEGCPEEFFPCLEVEMGTGAPHVGDDALTNEFTIQSLDGDVGTFTGDLPEGCSDNDYARCFAYYPTDMPISNPLSVQTYASEAENLSMNKLYRYDYMYSAIDGMNGTTPTVNFKHRVALLDITIKPIGIKRNIDRIGVEYIVDYGEGYTPTQKYVVEYNTSQTFQDTARVIIAVSPAVYSNFGNSSFGGIPQNSEIKVYFKTKSESSHEPTETNTYTKTITKAGGVSIEAGKYYALTFNNPRCNGVAYNPSTHWCDNGTIKVLSTCNNELFNPSTQWCNECPECNGGKIDDYLFDGRDGQKYKTVKIGNQTWMAENLKYEYKINGVDASWCYKNEEINNFDHCEEVGRYYLWSAAMDSAGIVALANKVPNSKIVDEETIEGFGCGNGVTCTPNIPHRGVCPEGWHVPTKEEYETLFNAAGGSNNAGNKLRSTTGIFWKILGTDDFGFSARAGGGFDYAQNKVSGTGMGSLWTASWNQDKDNPYAAAFSPSPKVSVGPKSQTYALTLRCLKDTDTGN